MTRLSSAPLFTQALALVVATAIGAQLVTLAALDLLPGGSEPFTFDDVAAVARTGRPVEREGQRLEPSRSDDAPPGWELDGNRERSARVTLADLIGVAPERVLVEDQIPIPGGQWIIRLSRQDTQRPLADYQPWPNGGEVRLGDYAAAVERGDGRWIVIYPPADWPGPGLLLLIWLGANALVLVPLAWLFTRRLVAPIRAFSEAADRAGQGDPLAAFPRSGPREVQVAARALAEMQRKIQGAAEEKTKLLAAIAHDLRTPLTRLRFRAEYAPPDQRDRIVKDIERMDAMIGGVLAFVRGEDQAQRRRLDFAALVESVVDDWADLGADVSLSGSCPVEVEGDPLALRRLVSNLVENAVKYAGNARCTVGRAGGDALLTIDDDGPGIAGGSLERLFTPFERGDSTRDPATGGVGLGLALARGIARAHGGDVRLERPPKGGLRALVRIPAVDDAESISPSPQA